MVAAVDVHDDRSLCFPFLERCDANCDELASRGVRSLVNFLLAVRCDPEAPPDVVLIQTSQETIRVNPLFGTGWLLSVGLVTMPAFPMHCVMSGSSVDIRRHAHRSLGIFGVLFPSFVFLFLSVYYFRHPSYLLIAALYSSVVRSVFEVVLVDHVILDVSRVFSLR